MGEGWGEGEKKAFQLITPSPLSPPTRGGELGLFTSFSIYACRIFCQWLAKPTYISLKAYLPGWYGYTGCLLYLIL
jgi:hypothetical protein